jgi:phosphoglycolate phosphatase
MQAETTPRLLVFDLDGTLIDSRTDLTNSINAMLTHFGKPILPEPVIASYLGDGASMLVRRALGDPEGDIHDEEYVTEALTFFLDFYRIHKVDFTTVYSGVFESLEHIRRTQPNLPIAVLTNKPVNPSRDICDHFNLSRFFFQNYGGNSFHTKKPAPHGLLTLIAEASELVGESISPTQTVMVGDSDVDVLTARNCGARSIGCTFGFSPHALAASRPDLFANSPHDWPTLLNLR